MQIKCIYLYQPCATTWVSLPLQLCLWCRSPEDSAFLLRRYSRHLVSNNHAWNHRSTGQFILFMKNVPWRAKHLGWHAKLAILFILHMYFSINKHLHSQQQFPLKFPKDKGNIKLFKNFWSSLSLYRDHEAKICRTHWNLFVDIWITNGATDTCKWGGSNEWLWTRHSGGWVISN